MIEPVFLILEALSNAKSLLDIASTVFRYVKRKSASLESTEIGSNIPSQIESHHRVKATLDALEATLNEWKHIAATIEPDIKREVRQHDVTSLTERAAALAELAKQYAVEQTQSSHSDFDHIILRHTNLVANREGGLQLLLGQSRQTQPLQGEALNILSRRVAALDQISGVLETSGGKMGLPVFKVTMLGNTGVGKTVFMASMYAKLRFAPHRIAIRAIKDDVDRELDLIMRELYLNKKWPEGTDINEQKYEFELLLGTKPIALIDWVDYRGGVLDGASSEEGKSTLIKRLQESHSIIWMVDMSRLGDHSINSFYAQLMTGIGQMAHLCRQAARADNRYRPIFFVRTKSDEVIGDNGKPDLARACTQLIEHIGRDNFSDIPFCAAIPISASGKVDTDKKPTGTNPENVEWPLILSLAFLLESELRGLNKEKNNAHQELIEANPGRVLSFFKELVGAPPTAKELQAIEKRDKLALHIMGMREVIVELVKNCPPSIKMF